MTENITIEHSFTSPAPGPSRPGLVGSAEWNEALRVTLAGVLKALDALSPAAGTFPTFTGPEGAQLRPISSLALTLLALASEADVRQALGAAPTHNPTFTGTVNVPSITGTSDNSEKAAPTSFVQAVVEAAVSRLLGDAPPAALDTLNELAEALGDDADYAASIATALALKAPLSSPAFTDNPTAPTVAGTADSSNKLATTAFVQAVRALLAPLASPALTGNPTTPDQSPGDNSGKIANTKYADNAASAAAAAVSARGGFLNKFRNAPLDIWQRGTSGTIVAGTPAIAADGWYAGSTGANGAWSRQAGRSLTRYSLRLTGATSLTDLFARQRIEGSVVKVFAGDTVTVQARIYNGSGGSITPTLTVKHANAEDNWSAATTDVNAQALQACANGAWTLVSYTFTAHADAGNGIEVTFDFGNNFGSNAKYVQIAEPDIRSASSVQAPELRPIGVELAFCQRYFCKTFPQATAPQSNAGDAGALFTPWSASAGAPVGAMWRFPCVMRTSPTIATYRPDAAGTTFSTGLAVSGIAGTTDCSTHIFNNAGGTAGTTIYSIQATADAEL